MEISFRDSIIKEVCVIEKTASAKSTLVLVKLFNCDAWQLSMKGERGRGFPLPVTPFLISEIIKVSRIRIAILFLS